MDTLLKDIDGIGAETLKVFEAAGFKRVGDLVSREGQELRVQLAIQELKADEPQALLNERRWMRLASRCTTVIERVRSSEAMPFAPECFCCPITLDWFIDPVVTRYGDTYERHAIERCIREQGTDPLSQRPLEMCDLFENHAMRDAVAYHLRHFMRFVVPLRPQPPRQ